MSGQAHSSQSQADRGEASGGGSAAQCRPVAGASVAGAGCEPGDVPSLAVAVWRDEGQRSPSSFSGRSEFLFSNVGSERARNEFSVTVSVRLQSPLQR